MKKRADGLRAATTRPRSLQMLVEVLPQVAHEVAAPMAAIDKLTVISQEGAGALPKAVSNNLMQTLQLVQDTTGFDLGAALGGVLGQQDAQPAGGSTNGTVAKP